MSKYVKDRLRERLEILRVGLKDEIGSYNEMMINLGNEYNEPYPQNVKWKLDEFQEFIDFCNGEYIAVNGVLNHLDKMKDPMEDGRNSIIFSVIKAKERLDVELKPSREVVPVGVPERDNLERNIRKQYGIMTGYAMVLSFFHMRPEPFKTNHKIKVKQE